MVKHKIYMFVIGVLSVFCGGILFIKTFLYIIQALWSSLISYF